MKKGINDFSLNSRICIYGTGNYSTKLFNLFRKKRPDVQIIRFINTYKNGELFGVEIIKPDLIKQIMSEFDLIVIASEAYSKDMMTILDGMGITNYCSFSDNINNRPHKDDFSKAREISLKKARNNIAENNLQKAMTHLLSLTNCNKNDYDYLYLLAHVKTLLGHSITYQKKIGFLVNYQVHIAQFCNIWRHLPIDSYEIIIEQHPYDASCPLDLYYNPLREYLVEHDLPFVDLSECINNLVTYKALMTVDHSFAAFPAVDYAYRITLNHVKIISHGFRDYKSGKIKLKSLNIGINDYDTLFLQGYNQVKQIDDAGFNGDIFVVGYPRLDNYFDKNNSDQDSPCLELLNLDPDKKTILWTPTSSITSSLHYHHESIRLLCESYNMVLKPHNVSFSIDSENEIIQHLEKNGVLIVKSSFDDGLLFKIADYIFADYGGSVMSSVYMNAKLVLLNTPEEFNTGAVCKTSEIARRDIPSVNPSKKAHKDIIYILENDELWESVKRTNIALKRYYFAPFDGFSGKIAATVLSNML